MADMTDEALVRMSVKRLNKVLCMGGFSADETKRIKKRRRLLKNRSYSQTSRTKRVQQKENLEREVKQLRGALEHLEREVKQLRGALEQLEREKRTLKRETDEARKKCHLLQKLLTNRTRMVGLHESSRAENEIQVDVVGIEEEQNPHDACYE